MELRRVVVTGMGMVRPLGLRRRGHLVATCLAGKSGAKRIDDFQVDDIACQIARVIPRGRAGEGKFNPDDWMDPKEQRKVDPFIIYAHGRRRPGDRAMPAASPKTEESASAPAC